MGGHGGGGHGGGHGGHGGHGWGRGGWGQGALLLGDGYDSLDLLDFDLDADYDTDALRAIDMSLGIVPMGRRFARLGRSVIIGDEQDTPDPDSGDSGEGTTGYTDPTDAGGSQDDSWADQSLGDGSSDDGSGGGSDDGSDPFASSDMAYAGRALTAMSAAGVGEGGSNTSDQYDPGDAGSYLADDSGSGGSYDSSGGSGGGYVDRDDSGAGGYAQAPVYAQAPDDGGYAYDDGGDGGGDGGGAQYDDSPDEGGGDQGGGGSGSGGGGPSGGGDSGQPPQPTDDDKKKHKYGKKQRAAWLAKKAAAAAAAAGLPSTSLAQEQATYGSRALSAADLATQQSAAAAAVALGDATANMTGHKLVNGVNTAVNAPGRYAARVAARNAAAAAAGGSSPAASSLPSLASLFTAPPPPPDPTQGVIAQHLAGNPTLASNAILGLRFPTVAATPAPDPTTVLASTKSGLLGGSGAPPPVGSSMVFSKSVPAASLGLGGGTPPPADPYAMMHHAAVPGIGPSPKSAATSKPVVRAAPRPVVRAASKPAPKKAAPRPIARIHGEGEFGDDRGTIDVGDDMGTMDDSWPLGGLDDITGNAYVRPMDMSTFSDDESCTTNLDPTAQWDNPLVVDPRYDIEWDGEGGYATATAMFPGDLDPLELGPDYPCHTGDEWDYDAMSGQPAMMIAGEAGEGGYSDDWESKDNPWGKPECCDVYNAGYEFNPRIGCDDVGGDFDSDVGHQMRLKG
jgi:hypothetical protein